MATGTRRARIPHLKWAAVAWRAHRLRTPGGTRTTRGCLTDRDYDSPNIAAIAFSNGVKIDVMNALMMLLNVVVKISRRSCCIRMAPWNLAARRAGMCYEATLVCTNAMRGHTASCPCYRSPSSCNPERGCLAERDGIIGTAAAARSFALALGGQPVSRCGSERPPVQFGRGFVLQHGLNALHHVRRQ